MPALEEICTVVANGRRYETWKSVSVELSYDNVVAHLRLTVAEVGGVPGSKGIAALRLTIGDDVQAYLAGRKVIDGIVTVRQVYYNKGVHELMIVVSSRTYRIDISTVDGEPGQYLNSTCQQIGSAVFGKCGVNFSVDGSAPGANKPFPRVSEQIGETRFAFVERLCRMRDLQMIDDLNGGIRCTRNASASVVAALVEGQNIESARMVMSIDDSADGLVTKGQREQSDENFTEGPSSKAETSVPDVPPSVPVTIACELNADNQDCAMRANRERSQMLYEQLDVEIVVPKWLRDDNTLWIEHINSRITVYSPMLFPDDTMTLWLKGVKHQQSDEIGTVTTLLLSFLPGGDGLQTLGFTPPPVDVSG